jgi:hypothetical protein
MDLRLVNPPPEGNDGNTERASNGGPKERANIEVAAPHPLRNGPGCEARQERNAADAQNVLPGRTLFQPAAHELCASLRELAISKVPASPASSRCQGPLDSQQSISLLGLPSRAGRNLAVRGRLTLPPLVTQHRGVSSRSTGVSPGSGCACKSLRISDLHTCAAPGSTRHRSWAPTRETGTEHEGSAGWPAWPSVAGPLLDDHRTRGLGRGEKPVRASSLLARDSRGHGRATYSGGCRDRVQASPKRPGRSCHFQHRTAGFPRQWRHEPMISPAGGRGRRAGERAADRGRRSPRPAVR